MTELRFKENLLVYFRGKKKFSEPVCNKIAGIPFWSNHDASCFKLYPYPFNESDELFKLVGNRAMHDNSIWVKLK